MGSISLKSLHTWFVLISGVLLFAKPSVAQSEKLSENGANVCLTNSTTDREQYKCCKGWSQVGNQCTKAICIQPCVNGTCTKPDYCSCNKGYHGHQCERNVDCPLDKWGPQGCTNDCHCLKNEMCSPQTGQCVGFIGLANDGEDCKFPYYGENCQYLTICYNGASPAPGGKCICADGYYGERCGYECEQGTFGHNCSKTCKCPKNYLCSHINGNCCECYNNATCHLNGSCDCSPGWTGEKCGQASRSIKENQPTNCSCVNQTVDVKTCQCRLNNNSSSTPATDLRLLALLAVIPLILIVVCIVLYCKKRICHGNGNEENGLDSQEMESSNSNPKDKLLALGPMNCNNVPQSPQTSSPPRSGSESGNAYEENGLDSQEKESSNSNPKDKLLGPMDCNNEPQSPQTSSPPRSGSGSESGNGESGFDSQEEESSNWNPQKKLLDHLARKNVPQSPQTSSPPSRVSKKHPDYCEKITKGLNENREKKNQSSGQLPKDT